MFSTKGIQLPDLFGTPEDISKATKIRERRVSEYATTFYAMSSMTDSEFRDLVLRPTSAFARWLDAKYWIVTQAYEISSVTYYPYQFDKERVCDYCNKPFSPKSDRFTERIKRTCSKSCQTARWWSRRTLPDHW